jgi:hypothetical protein
MHTRFWRIPTHSSCSFPSSHSFLPMHLFSLIRTRSPLSALVFDAFALAFDVFTLVWISHRSRLAFMPVDSFSCPLARFDVRWLVFMPAASFSCPLAHFYTHQLFFMCARLFLCLPTHSRASSLIFMHATHSLVPAYSFSCLPLIFLPAHSLSRTPTWSFAAILILSHRTHVHIHSHWPPVLICTRLHSKACLRCRSTYTRISLFSLIHACSCSYAFAFCHLHLLLVVCVCSCSYAFTFTCAPVGRPYIGVSMGFWRVRVLLYLLHRIQSVFSPSHYYFWTPLQPPYHALDEMWLPLCAFFALCAIDKDE